MNLQELSRCTGFPPEVLQSFASQGILECAVNRAIEKDNLFDGRSFLRTLVELKHGK